MRLDPLSIPIERAISAIIATEPIPAFIRSTLDCFRPEAIGKRERLKSPAPFGEVNLHRSVSSKLHASTCLCVTPP